MMEKKLVFKPNEIWLNIDFNQIKNKLKVKYNIKDYESIIIIHDEGISLSVTSLGEVIVLKKDNNIADEVIQAIIDEIENIFKEQIPEFKFEDHLNYKAMFKLLCNERNNSDKGCVNCPCYDICKE